MSIQTQGDMKVVSKPLQAATRLRCRCLLNLGLHLLLVGLSSLPPIASASESRHNAGRVEDHTSRDFHNLFVIIIAGLALAWMIKVLYQLFRAADLNTRLSRTQSLQLEGMSIYANDFQILIRQHFNQILRIRRTVPPKPVTRLALSVHLHPDSIGVCSGDGTTGAGAKTGASFGVQFTVDALVPCCVKLFWGVSIPACNDFVQRRQHGSQANVDVHGRWNTGRGGKVCGGRGGTVVSEANVGRGRRWPRPATTAAESTRSLLEMEELSGTTVAGACVSEDNQNIFLPGQFVAQSRDFFLPAGVTQRYITPAGDLIDATQLPFDVSASWLREGQAMDDAAVVPLAIVIIAQRRPSHELGAVQGRPVVEATGQVSFVRFRGPGTGEVGPRAPEIIRQLSFGERSAAFEIHGVYGFEDEGEGDCMICYTRSKNVLLLPCRHCSVCHPCLRSLRDEKCPLCRSVFSSYVTFPINRSTQQVDSNRATGVQAIHHPGNAVTTLSASPVSATPPVSAAAAGGPLEQVRSDQEPQSLGTSRTSSVGVSGNNSGMCDNNAPTGPCCGEASVAGTALAQAAASDTQESARAHVEPTRQARELQLGRKRGVAPASRTTAQGLRLSGRARISDRTDSADMPLLQEGVVAQSRGPEGEGEAEDCRSRREPASSAAPSLPLAVSESPSEETHVLIQEGFADTV